MLLNPEKPPLPATLDLAAVHAAAAAEIEKKHAKALKQLRADHAGWMDRQSAISSDAIARAEAELIDKWEKGLIPAGELLTRPSAENLTHRLHLAGSRIESYEVKLEKDAAPITADVLDLIADNIEASFTTRAQQLDRDAAKEFGHGAGVEARLRSSIAKHRTEAGEFRAGSYQFALTRLNDYIDL